MSKVMIVEDDDSLREIYGIRLAAEGYAVVSARDGEEALAVAVKERPDLIISDVMMPKISGFDMLDILRSTPETANIKVIMMTALSSDDQRDRGENLGADRYLVKSQVGIEDVVNVVHEVLNDRTADGLVSATPNPALTAPAAATQPAITAMPSTPTAAQMPTPTQSSVTPAPAPAQNTVPAAAPNPVSLVSDPTLPPLPDPNASTPIPDNIIPPVA